MPKPDFHSNFKYFFQIIWAPYYCFSPKILILKHIFYFLKSVKGGPLTKLLQLLQTDWFSTKILILKLIFFFLKSVKLGRLTKLFANPANFNRPLYQSQDFIRTLNIFPYYLSYLLLIQPKNFNFKAHFLFSKKCKGGTLTKTFPTPANFYGLLYQSQDFIRLLNIFSILFELPTIDSAQKF